MNGEISVPPLITIKDEKKQKSEKLLNFRSSSQSLLKKNLIIPQNTHNRKNLFPNDFFKNINLHKLDIKNDNKILSNKVLDKNNNYMPIVPNIRRYNDNRFYRKDNISCQEKKSSDIVIIDLQKDLDEDQELLNLLNDTYNQKNPKNINKSNGQNEQDNENNNSFIKELDLNIQQSKPIIHKQSTIKNNNLNIKTTSLSKEMKDLEIKIKPKTCQYSKRNLNSLNQSNNTKNNNNFSDTPSTEEVTYDSNIKYKSNYLPYDINNNNILLNNQNINNSNNFSKKNKFDCLIDKYLDNNNVFASTNNKQKLYIDDKKLILPELIRSNKKIIINYNSNNNSNINNNNFENDFKKFKEKFRKIKYIK